MQRYRNGRVIIQQGDITRLSVDAIVSAANPKLSGGGPAGGVSAAIHKAAGPGLDAACRELKGCEVGEARTTAGFDLPASWVVHAVGPMWQGGSKDEDALLADTYSSALREAMEAGATSVALPAISTGGNRFPKQRAAQIAVSTVLEFLEQHAAIEQVIFCCFSDADLAIYEAVAEEYL